MNSQFYEYSQPKYVLTNAAFFIANSRQQLENFSGYQSFESTEEYQDLIFPLLQNEQYSSFSGFDFKILNIVNQMYRSLKREQIRVLNYLKDRNQFPLVFEIILNDDENPSREDGIKFDVLREVNHMKNEYPNKNEFWKYNHYAQYLIFKQSQQYFGAIYTKKPDQPNDYFTSLAIFSNKNDEMSLLLPYTKEVLQLLKFENIFTTHEKLIDYQNKYIQCQQQGKNKFCTIWDKQMLIYFLPISPLSAYLNETETIFNLSRCPFYQLILNPCQQQNHNLHSDFILQQGDNKNYISKIKYIQINLMTINYRINDLNTLQIQLDMPQILLKELQQLKALQEQVRHKPLQELQQLCQNYQLKHKIIIKELFWYQQNQIVLSMIQLERFRIILNKRTQLFSVLKKNLINQRQYVLVDQKNVIETLKDGVQKQDLKIIFFIVVNFIYYNIQQYNLYIQNRKKNYLNQLQFKCKDKVKELEDKSITFSIKSQLRKQQLRGFRVYLEDTQQYNKNFGFIYNILLYLY